MTLPRQREEEREGKRGQWRKSGIVEAAHDLSSVTFEKEKERERERDGVNEMKIVLS